MQIRSELGRSAGTKDGNPFLFFHLENPMDWEYTMVTVCVRQDCSDLTHEISLERFLIIYIYIYIYEYITLVLFIHCQWHAQQQQQQKTVHLLISFQSQSRVQLFVAPWIALRQASLSITNYRSSQKHMFIETMMPSIHLILCHSLLPLIQIPPIIRDFYESTLLVRWPMYWSFSFSISPSKKHPRLISWRMDWWDLLAVQGNLKSLLQNHSSKASVFFGTQFSSQSKSHINIWPLEKP